MRRNNLSLHSYDINMNVLKDLIQRCHQHRKQPLQQRKTVTTPALYKGRNYHFTVLCAWKYPVRLYELEQACISFMPIGSAPMHDRGPMNLGDERFFRRQGLQDWDVSLWQRSWGIQIYTGTPSERDNAQWHDIEFKYDAICASPDAVLACIEALANVVANPLLTLTKSGGLRFSCRVSDYLHPNTNETKQYIYKHTPTPENPHQRDLYLQVLGDKGYSRWDARYEILLGNLLDPPIITKEVLFASIDPLRTALHQPAPSIEMESESTVQTATVVPASLGSLNLNLAKQALLKRGFSYVEKKNNVHHWSISDNKQTPKYISLWEDENAVWIRASTPNTGLPTEATYITDVWDDTGILPPIPATGLPLSEKILAVREGKLSPLAIKRPPLTLHKPEHESEICQTLEENTDQIQRVLNQDARFLKLTIPKTGEGKYDAIASYVRNGGAISVNIKPFLANETEQHFQKQNLPSFAHWKPRTHLWEQAKEISVEVRMATPFQHGNVCEDPERCDALEQKGGNPSESICPQCPVYIECQERGYLSQFTAFKSIKAQLSSPTGLLLNPQYSEVAEAMLDQTDDTQRLCIIDEVGVENLFVKCRVSKNTFEAWRVNWQRDTLGNFANALLNALEIKKGFEGNAIRRLRAAIEAFQGQEETIVQQMCQVNIPGKNVPMSMTEAIALGILDTATVENIQAFPTVYRDPNWTLWHQLKRFFTYYTRDADAPMLWDGHTLQFWVPPVLHPSVKRLLFMLSNISERDLHNAFPDEKIEIAHIKPTTWIKGNQVFQIRTGIHPRQAILNYENDWDILGTSIIGQRFLLGIKSEIKRDPNVKHAIISVIPIIEHLTNITAMENVCCAINFKDAHRAQIALETADVIWIIGIPHWTPGMYWRHSQILFGNDEKPLCYEGETDYGRYKDERVQRVHDRSVVSLLTEIIGRVGLNRLPNKTVVLLTSMPLPGITDRPETLLFDWEDFEIAGRLNKLPEVIAERQRFETERDNLTAESDRQKVEQILGISKSQANRVLMKLRGGKIERVPFHEQIHALLEGGEKTTAELIAAIDGHPGAVKNELKRLVDIGEIVKVRRAVYALPSE